MGLFLLCAVRWLMNGEKLQYFLCFRCCVRRRIITFDSFAVYCISLFNLNCFQSLDFDCWQIETIKVTEKLIEFATCEEIEMNSTWFLRLDDNFVCCLKSIVDMVLPSSPTPISRQSIHQIPFNCQAMAQVSLIVCIHLILRVCSCNFLTYGNWRCVGVGRSVCLFVFRLFACPKNWKKWKRHGNDNK